MKQPVLLVVDREDCTLAALKISAPDQWRILACQDWENIPERGFDAAFVDISCPGGLAVARRLRAKHPSLEIVAASENLDRGLMEACLEAGASRFLAKPLNPAESGLILSKIEAHLRLRSPRPGDMQWVGSSAASHRVRRQIAELREESGPLLIEGESGTGKEVCAQLLHIQEDGGPMVVVNVASLPENLFESEFFGHVKGAFTGADQNKVGLAEAAHQGDLFLDEIEAMSLSAQSKLLRFLESGEIRRVGAQTSIKIQTRVIAATNRNLNQLVEEGRFREDLLWRLGGKKILLPPLRERPQDIPDLVHHFLEQDQARKKHIADDAMQALREHSWPGNVRELKRVCEQLLVQAPLPILRAEDVYSVLRPQIAGPSASIDLGRGLGRLVADFEARILEKAINGQNNIDDIARLLKISRSSLYKKIKDYNIQWRNDA